MAFTEDLITRLRADTGDYESNIRKATASVEALAASTRRLGVADDGLMGGSQHLGVAITSTSAATEKLETNIGRTTAGYLKFGNAARATAMAVEGFAAGGDRAMFALASLGPQLTNVTAGLAASGTAAGAALAPILALVGPIAAVGAALAVAYPWLSKFGEGWGDLAGGAAGASSGTISRAAQDAADKIEALQKAEDEKGREHLAQREAAAQAAAARRTKEQLEWQAKQKAKARAEESRQERAALEERARQIADWYNKADKTKQHFHELDIARIAKLNAAEKARAAEPTGGGVYAAAGMVIPAAGFPEASAHERAALEARNHADAIKELAASLGQMPVSMNEAVAAMVLFTEGTISSQEAAVQLGTYMLGTFGQVMGAGAAAALNQYLGASVKFVSANQKQQAAARAAQLSSGEAFRAAARDAIKAIAMEAIVRAAMEGALALASLARYDFNAAARHASAAAAFAALGGVAATATAAIAPVTKRLPGTEAAAGGAGARGGAPIEAGRERESVRRIEINIYVPVGGRQAAAREIVEVLRGLGDEEGRTVVELLAS